MKNVEECKKYAITTKLKIDHPYGRLVSYKQSNQWGSYSISDSGKHV